MRKTIGLVIAILEIMAVQGKAQDVFVVTPVIPFGITDNDSIGGYISEGQLLFSSWQGFPILYGTTAYNDLTYKGEPPEGYAEGDGIIFSLQFPNFFGNAHVFSGYDGSHPTVGMIQSDGSLYGTTSQGGAKGFGTIFCIANANRQNGGNFETLHSFTGSDGSSPNALIEGSDGLLYGTTSKGGARGQGTVFKMSPTGEMEVLHSFMGGPDGANPVTGVVEGKNGLFYGTTQSGGNNGDHGTIFCVTATGNFTNLLSFDGANGDTPNGLTRGRDGNFYGTTSEGGAYGYGVVFKMTPQGEFINLHSFNGNDAALPVGGLAQDSDGSFYGVSTYGGLGGGSIFRVAPDGKVTEAYAFQGPDIGAYPLAGLVRASDGNFYGTTSWLGYYGIGAVYQFTVYSTPVITMQPKNQKRLVGNEVVFSVSATASEALDYPLSYSWLRNDNYLSDSGNIVGSSTRSLTIRNVTMDDAGTYFVGVSSSYPGLFATSQNVTLTVIPDTAAPTISIIEPISNQRTAIPGMFGVAQDNVQVASVSFWLTNLNTATVTSGNALLWPGLTSRIWQVTNTPLPGSNILAVQSVDFSSNVSAIVTRKFFYKAH